MIINRIFHIVLSFTVIMGLFLFIWSLNSLGPVDHQGTTGKAKIISETKATTEAEPVLCGNGFLDPGETCDPQDPLDGIICNLDCTISLYNNTFECVEMLQTQHCTEEAEYDTCLQTLLDRCPDISLQK